MSFLAEKSPEGPKDAGSRRIRAHDALERGFRFFAPVPSILERVNLGHPQIPATEP